MVSFLKVVELLCGQKKIMIRISWVLKKSNYRVASERIRFFNLQPYFKNSTQVHVEKYSKTKFLKKYDIIVFLKKYDKSALNIAKKNTKSIIILDLCDFDFYNNISNSKNINEFLKYTSLITCTTPKLKESIIKKLNFPSEKIIVIQDSFDEFNPKIFYKNKISDFFNSYFEIKSVKTFNKKYIDKVKLVWFGNSSGSYEKSGLYSLNKSIDILNDFNDLSPLTLTIITDKFSNINFINDLNFPVNYVKWNPLSFYKIIREYDIAFLPIVKNPFNNVKSHNRITTALNNDLHVITDSIESYRQFDDYLILDNHLSSFKKFLSSNDLSLSNKKYNRSLFSKFEKENISKIWIELFLKLKYEY